MHWLIRIESSSSGSGELSSVFGEPDVVVTMNPPSIVVYEPSQDENNVVEEWKAIVESLTRIETALSLSQHMDTQITLHLHIGDRDLVGVLDVPSTLVAALGRVRGKLEIYCCV